MLRILLLTLLLLTTHYSLFTISANSSAPPPIPKIPLPEDLNTTESQESQQSEESENVLEPPPQVKLQVPPPKNEEEAFKRIEDYKTLIKIIPPGTSEESIKKQVFGEYKDLVEPYLEEEEEEEENYSDNRLYKENTYSNSDFQNFEQKYSQQKEEIQENENFRTSKPEVITSEKRKKELSLTKALIENVPERAPKTPHKTAYTDFPLLPLIGFTILSIIFAAYLLLALKWRKND